MYQQLIFSLKNHPKYFDAMLIDDPENLIIPSDAVCIRLENTPITDEQLYQIKNNKVLRCIDLDQSLITNKSMLLLSELTTLEEINIEGTRVTDEGIMLLGKLPNLKLLTAYDSDMTIVGYNYLKTKVPGIEIYV